MHIDLEQSGAGSSFQSTVCVIGGGIAGLILAMRLAKQGIRVHLLEAGGLEFEERSQALYNAEMSDANHRGSNNGRARTFGGSSTRWGGQILPFTPDIFEPASGMPSERWPISAQELAAYYQDAQGILGVNSLPFTADLVSALGHRTIPACDDVVIRFSKWAPFNRRNLAKTAGAEAMAHSGVTLFTHANVAELIHSPDRPGRISEVRVLNYARKEFLFSADYFVICAGTVESSRLLLCSRSVPNSHDQIGRYFHDHVAFIAAQFVSPGRERALRMLGPFYRNGTTHTCKFEASPQLRSRIGLLPALAYILIDEPEDSGAAALRSMLRSIQRGQVKSGVTANLAPMLRSGGDIARLVYSSKFEGRRAVCNRATLQLTVDVEQSADRRNRVRVSDTKRDALGMPTTVIDWHVNEPEQDTARQYAQLIRKYLESLNLGPLEWSPEVIEYALPTMSDTNHPMGGLRIGDNASRSVVNRDLAVHGLANLHVASCAVFPSGSSSNPTFTMMALTLRLADHLAREISRQGVMRYGLIA